MDILGGDTPHSQRIEDSNVAPAARADRPPVVLQVLPALVTGGAERGTVDVAAAVAAAGWTSLVASSGGPMVREVERAGVTHLTLPLDSKNPFVVRANIERLGQAIAAHGVDIVHGRSRAPAWSALYAARRAGVRFVTTFHGTYNFSNPAKRWYNSVMARGDRVIAASRFIVDHVVRHYNTSPGMLRHIPRGIDLDRFDPAKVSGPRLARLAKEWRLADGVPVVMLPGRLTRWKGQAVLIDAIALRGKRDLRCLLVGSDQGRGAYRRELEQRIAAHGLETVVHLIDECSDMPAALKLADLVVSASTDPEAFGRVAVEAQAMGRPIVATRHGGSLETVLDGETGWLIEPGNPAPLAQAIDAALAMGAEERQAIAQRGIAHVRANFSRELMCARTLEVYRELLAEMPVAHPGIAAAGGQVAA
ncbi:MAG: glycosyltransferase family 4 protein [Alphaproteobacteria bacterium]|nr:glycosyltransferase family 4 protein [Alphaproteobacteria bacterium]